MKRKQTRTDCSVISQGPAPFRVVMPRPRLFFIALFLGAGVLVGCGNKEEPAPAPAPASASAAGDARMVVGAERIALLIGNGAYAGDAKLANPANDAEDYGAALNRAGFNVEVKTDLDRDAMIETIRAFGEKAKAIQGIALFYFAGHGMAAGGTNYLLPVNIKPDQDNDSLSMAGIDANKVIKLLGESAGRVNVAVFDMCRNLPSRGMRGGGEGGLVRMEAANGSLLAFATQFGARAKDGIGQRNSPYAKQLIAALDTQGLTVTDYFGVVRQGVRQGTGGDQVPEETNRLEGRAPLLVPRPAVDPNAMDPLVKINAVAADTSKLQTRYGQLEFAQDDNGLILRLDGTTIFQGEQGGWLAIDKYIQRGDQDIVLFAYQCSGNLCRAQLHFLLVGRNEKPQILTDDSLDGPSAEVVSSDRDSLVFSTGYFGGKRQYAVLKQSELIVRLESEKKSPLDSSLCKTLFDDVLPNCASDKHRCDELRDGRGYLGNAYQSWLFEASRYPGFSRNAFDTFCADTCDGKPEIAFTTFATEVCSTP